MRIIKRSKRGRSVTETDTFEVGLNGGEAHNRLMLHGQTVAGTTVVTWLSTAEARKLWNFLATAPAASDIREHGGTTS